MSTKKSSRGTYTNEITITPHGDKTTDNITIKDAEKVNNLKIDISKSMDTIKYATKSNQHLEVEFCINGDSDPIYVLQEEGGHTKHIKHLVVDNSKKQSVSIEGLNSLDNLEIRVYKCNNN